MVCLHCGSVIWKELSRPFGRVAYAYRDRGGNICPKDGYWHQPKKEEA